MAKSAEDCLKDIVIFVYVGILRSFLASKLSTVKYYTNKNTNATGGTVRLTKSQWAESSLIISTIKKGKKNYIVCEERQLWGTFADGDQQDFWILQYTKNKFRYVRSLTQTAGGSSGFEYTAYVLKSSGKLKSSKIFYSEEDETGKKGKYKTSSAALKAFFKPCKISLTKKADYFGKMGKSVLASSNKGKTVFKFQNIQTSHDYNTRTYKFKAKIKTKNKFK